MVCLLSLVPQAVSELFTLNINAINIGTHQFVSLLSYAKPNTPVRRWVQSKAELLVEADVGARAFGVTEVSISPFSPFFFLRV